MGFAHFIIMKPAKEKPVLGAIIVNHAFQTPCVVGVAKITIVWKEVQILRAACLKIGTTASVSKLNVLHNHRLLRKKKLKAKQQFLLLNRRSL